MSIPQTLTRDARDRDGAPPPALVWAGRPPASGHSRLPPEPEVRASEPGWAHPVAAHLGHALHWNAFGCNICAPLCPPPDIISSSARRSPRSACGGRRLTQLGGARDLTAALSPGALSAVSYVHERSTHPFSRHRRNGAAANGNGNGAAGAPSSASIELAHRAFAACQGSYAPYSECPSGAPWSRLPTSGLPQRGFSFPDDLTAWRLHVVSCGRRGADDEAGDHARGGRPGVRSLQPDPPAVAVRARCGGRGRRRELVRRHRRVSHPAET